MKTQLNYHKAACQTWQISLNNTVGVCSMKKIMLMVKNVLNINYSDNNKTNDLDINGNTKSKPNGNSNCCRNKKFQLNDNHKKINIIYRAKVESGNSVKYQLNT